jgi:hypothetical protein
MGWTYIPACLVRITEGLGRPSREYSGYIRVTPVPPNRGDRGSPGVTVAAYAREGGRRGGSGRRAQGRGALGRRPRLRAWLGKRDGEQRGSDGRGSEQGLTPGGLWRARGGASRGGL